MTDSNPPAKVARKVLLTGATGFLGHHVAHVLISRGYEVVALCRDPDAPAARRLPKSVARLHGDILDADAVGSAALGCHAVIHCAGKVSRDPEDALELTRVNHDGMRVVFEACKKAGVRRAVLASTSGTIAISDDPDHVGNEEDERPVEFINRWAYYRSKFYAEQTALEFDDAEFEVVCVNPSLLLGPGDLHGSSTEDVRRFLEQPMPVAPAGGVSFVDARDAAEGLVLALEKGRAGQCYLLTACNCTTRTFLSRVARVGGVSAPMGALPKNALFKRFSVWAAGKAADLIGEDDAMPDAESVDIAQHYWYCDASKAETELGWSARDPMITLADTVNDLRERGIVMMSAPE